MNLCVISNIVFEVITASPLCERSRESAGVVSIRKALQVSILLASSLTSSSSFDTRVESGIRERFFFVMTTSIGKKKKLKILIRKEAFVDAEMQRRDSGGVRTRGESAGTY